MKPLPLRVVVLFAAFLLAAAAQGAYQRLHSFGDPAHCARTPMAGLTDGGDGYYYGVSQYGVGVSAGTVFRVRADGNGYAVIYSFAPIYSLGTETYSHLAATNGMLFGTRTATFAGSSTSLVYGVSTNGANYTVLHSFGSLPGDGKTASGGLLLDGSGFLYGATADGGTNGGGTVYRLQTSGAGYAILKHFENSYQSNGTNSRAPVGELVLDGNSFLYGVSTAGGAGTNGGTVFKLKTDGSGFARLHDFGVTPSDGYNLQTGLALDGSGTLFGVTFSGGADDVGTVFKLKTDGSSYARLHEFQFDFADVVNPDQKLLIGGDGNLYGATQYGGAYFEGGLYKLATDGSGYTVTLTCGANDDANPVGGLAWLSTGALLGENISGNPGEGAIFRVQPDGSNYTNLVNFVAAGGDATQPQSGLTLLADGYLYGTTFSGGPLLGGTLYRIATNGTGFALLHAFENGFADGFEPSAAPGFFSDGYLYGTTTHGGTNGGGTVYRIRPDGSGYVHLHDFAGGDNDGSQPAAEVSLAADGTLFGTAQAGGSNGMGVIFKMDRFGGGFALLHHFGAGTDGAEPSCALTLAGNVLYGTTLEGGAGAGTVFRINTDGSGYTSLYAFDPNNFDFDGQVPASGLVFGPDGMLYGTTTGGGYSQMLSNAFYGTGQYYGGGTIFRVATNGTSYAKVYDFANTATDPGFPQAGLVAGADGQLYGTAQTGGTAGGGQVFKITTNGVLTTVCSFQNSSLGAADGASPYAGVTLGPDGTIYGTTYKGGDLNLGAVFAVDPRVRFTAVQHFFQNGDTPRDVCRLSFQGVAGQVVTLQRSTNLLSWTSFSTNLLANGTDGLTNLLENPAPSPKAFYRAVTP